MRFFVFVVVVIVALLGIMIASSVRVEARDPYPDFCHDAPIDPFCVNGTGKLPEPVNPDDVIEVWFLMAPIWEFVVGNLMGDIHLYHSAIGFKNLNTGQNWTIEFDGVFESPNATLPFVVDVDPNDPTQGKEVIWCNPGALCLTDFINYPYWTSMTHMGTTNGSVFNLFFQWVPVENDTVSTTYETFNVYDHWDVNAKPYIHSYTCDDFAYRALGVLKWMGVEYIVDEFPKRDYLNIYSKKPVPVDASDPATMEKIITFYEKYQLKGKSKAEIALLLIEFLYSDKFILSEGQYYWLELHWPRFDWHFVNPPTVDPIDVSHMLNMTTTVPTKTAATEEPRRILNTNTKTTTLTVNP